MPDLPLIVFDVNETLLNLDTMSPTFERIFGDKAAMRLWFANFILYSAALTVAGRYVPFTDIVTPGTHSYTVWKRNLVAFAPLLFQ